MRPRQSTSSKQPHRPTRKLRLHPRAELVPAMDERTYAGFRDHIAARGMRVPLEITAAGVVIDGQHRLRAAIELGLTRVPVRVIGPQGGYGRVPREKRLPQRDPRLAPWGREARTEKPLRLIVSQVGYRSRSR